MSDHHDRTEHDLLERSLRQALRSDTAVDADGLMSAARARSRVLRRQRAARRGALGVGLAGAAVVGVALLPGRPAVLGWEPAGPTSDPTTPSSAEPDELASTATEDASPTLGLDTEDPSINVDFWNRDSDDNMPATVLWDSIWGSDGRSSDEILNAQDAAISECMGEAGFDYVESEFDSRPPTDDHGHVEGSVAWAQEWGYGVVAAPPQSDPADETPEEEAEWIAAISQPGYDAAEQQCFAQASAEVTPGYNELVAFRSTPAGSILDDLLLMRGGVLRFPGGEADGVIAEWSTCVAAAGYPASDPGFTGFGGALEQGLRSSYITAAEITGDEFLDAETAEGNLTAADRAQLVAEHPDLAQLAQQEIATAVADATCRDQVDLGERLVALEVEAQQAFIDEHREELDEAVAAFEDYLAEQS